MTDLERLELAIRRVEAGRAWETSTVAEFISDLIQAVTELNNYHSQFEAAHLEEARK